ncbi:AaceriAEL344Wp [[Ashbya] aceris (nom. inval.)]|nr:AaceriAEL344Wp [[Ashbya] aceris (nom. inval.)]
MAVDSQGPTDEVDSTEGVPGFDAVRPNSNSDGRDQDLELSSRLTEANLALVDGRVRLKGRAVDITERHGFLGEDDKSSVLSKVTSQEGDLELSELYISSDAETEKMDNNTEESDVPNLSSLVDQLSAHRDPKTYIQDANSGADDAVRDLQDVDDGLPNKGKKRHFEDEGGNTGEETQVNSVEGEDPHSDDQKFKKPRLPLSSANSNLPPLSGSDQPVANNIMETGLPPRQPDDDNSEDNEVEEDEEEEEEDEEEEEEEDEDIEENSNTKDTSIFKEKKKAPAGDEDEDEEEEDEEEDEDEEEEEEPSLIEREKLRQDALKDIIEIEYEFAELRQRLYENEMAKLQTELQMCLEGSHPALQTYYQKIDSIRDFKLKRAYQRQKYELECIDKETRAVRTFIHQNFYRQVSDLKHKLLNQTTQKWYDMNKERRDMDMLVSEIGYHVPVKIANKTLSCITGYAAPAQLKGDGDRLPEDLECEGINFRFRNNPVDKLEVIVDRMRFNNQLSDFEGLKKFFGGFPGAPSLNGLKDSEMYEDMQSLREQ